MLVLLSHNACHLQMEGHACVLCVCTNTCLCAECWGVCAVLHTNLQLLRHLFSVGSMWCSRDSFQLVIV